MAISHASTSSFRWRTTNKLLAALPAADLTRISPCLEQIPLTFRRVLHKDGERIRRVYFPTSGVCSVTSVMADGRMVEVAAIGSEGAVGVNVASHGDVAVGQTFVQIAEPRGHAYAMIVTAFKAEIAR